MGVQTEVKNRPYGSGRSKATTR